MRPIDREGTRLGLGFGQIIEAIVTGIWGDQAGFPSGSIAASAATSACTGLTIALFRIPRVHKRDRT
jgi:hypothetical protein